MNVRQVHVRLLPEEPGQPRRVRIHWFIHDAAGLVHNPSGTLATAAGPMLIQGAVGRIACQPAQKSATPYLVGREINLVPHSDDVRAATCPACLATDEAKKMLADLKETLETAGTGMPAQSE